MWKRMERKRSPHKCYASSASNSSLLQNDIWIGLGISFLLIKITAVVLYFLLRTKVPETNVHSALTLPFNPERKPHFPFALSFSFAELISDLQALNAPVTEWEFLEVTTKVQETAISSFANPLYKDLSSSGKVKPPGYATSPAVQISIPPWHEHPFNEGVNDTSSPNPLYGVGAEDMEKLCGSLKT